MAMYEKRDLTFRGKLFVTEKRKTITLQLNN